MNLQLTEIGEMIFVGYNFVSCRNSSQHPEKTPPVKERTKKKLSLRAFRNPSEQEEFDDQYSAEKDDSYDYVSKNPFHRAKKHIKTFIGDIFCLKLLTMSIIRNS